MTKQAWRDEFLMTMGAAGVRATDARQLLRLAARAHRLAEAACSGYWPAEDGQREAAYCPECEGGWHPSSFRRSLVDARGPKVCPDCRCEQDVRALVASSWPDGWRVVTQGDPRGAVVKLVRPGAVAGQWGDYATGDLVAVPS